MSLDPQIAALLETLDSGFPEVHTMTGAEARAAIRGRFVPAVEPEAVHEVCDAVVAGPGGDIPVRIYRPDGEDLPVLVYAHGGGFVFCDLDSHDALCRSFANLVPAIVVSVAYRLAPEHRWPAAADDVYAVVRAAADGTFGGDPRRIVVGGDSAGGNLAAVTAQLARDRGGPALAAQLLIYPVLAADFDTASYRLYGRGYYNPDLAMKWYWDQYVPQPSDRRHPYAAPLYGELSNLPPAILVIAGHDPLRDEALAYAGALEAAGTSVIRVQFDGAIHGFMSMAALDIAQQAHQQTCRMLRAAVGPSHG